MTNTRPTLTDGNLRLRQPVMADVAARTAAGNDAEIQFMYGVATKDAAPLTEKQAKDWVSYHVEQDHSWFIDVDGKLRGLIFLHSLNKNDRRGSLAMDLLRKVDLGRGYGPRALRLLLAHAFGAMSLHRISLRVLAYNTRAISAYKKVGFIVEGRERQSARVGDAWHDDVMMGLLAPEWRARA